MKHKVLSMRLDTEKPIYKTAGGSFAQPILFEVSGFEKELPYRVTAGRKKNLPESVANMQKRVDGYAGGVEVEVEGGKIYGVSFMLF